jgi:phage shock protein C
MSSAANSGLSGLRRNTKNARWLGVCAGVADWLDIPATLVRIVFIICVLTWPTLILGYFILYFCLSNDLDTAKVKDFVSNSSVKSHFSSVDYRKPIFKNQRDKRIAGVCSGIADYLEVSHFIVRAITLGSLLVFGPFTFWAYLICAFVFDPDPSTMDGDRYARKMAKKQRYSDKRRRRSEQRAENRAKRSGYSNSYVNEEYQSGENHSVNMESDGVDESNDKRQSNASAEDCAAIYQTMETRLRDIEAYMTSKQFRLHCEINRI